MNYLKKHWGVIKIKDMELDRSYNSIYMKARNLGLKKLRNWSKKETDYLLDSWGSISIKTIAKNLGRTEQAVTLRAGRLKLGPFLESGGYITFNQLFLALGKASGYNYTKQQWVDKGFPLKTRRVKNNSFHIVYMTDFWDWAEMNSTLINFSEMEPLILGPEPEWLKIQRQADTEKAFFKKTPWTKQEDEELIFLLAEYRYTYRELALKIRRTEGAIKRRMVDLKIKARPIRMPNHNPWTKKETETLIDYYHKGYDFEVIAGCVPRSAQACRGKVGRLIKEGRIFPRSEFRTTC